MFQVAHVARVGQQAVNSAAYHLAEPMSAEKMLFVATNGGARALGVFDEIGSLEVGKKADLLFVDVSQMDHQPIYDTIFVASNLVSGRDVDTVVVDGVVVMEKREMKTVDTDAIKAKLAERLPIISERFEKQIA